MLTESELTKINKGKDQINNQTKSFESKQQEKINTITSKVNTQHSKISSNARSLSISQSTQ